MFENIYETLMTFQTIKYNLKILDKAMKNISRAAIKLIFQLSTIYGGIIAWVEKILCINCEFYSYLASNFSDYQEQQSRLPSGQKLRQIIRH